jgi:transposase
LEAANKTAPFKHQILIIFREDDMQNNVTTKPRRRLSAEEKWQIYHECEQPGVKISEILRKYGLYSSDLQNIRRDVKEGALDRLRKSIPGRKPIVTISKDDHERLRRDYEEKEKALAELSVMLTVLKKKVNLE